MSYIPITDVSDHFPCIVSLNGLFLAKKECPEIKTQNMTDQNINEMKSVLDSHDWKSELSDLDVNDAFNYWFNSVI